jgi:predicted NAD/FAD-binding protein
LLQQHGHQVTLFEADPRLGGHTHTVDVTLDGVTAPVDTGFLVFNDRTYPKLVALFDTLGVRSVPSEMSFAVRVDDLDLEWAGTNLGAVFAQPRNALRPDFWRMLADIVRFNRAATASVDGEPGGAQTLEAFLDRGNYSKAFRDWYLLPMAAAIWSAPRREILGFPLRTFVRFCRNHGLLQLSDRPQWRTVAGGARSYVDRMASELTDVRLGTPVFRIRRGPQGVDVHSLGRVEHFDEVVLACHSDQALALLADPSAGETHHLRRIRYQPNRVVLHTDAALLPRTRKTWSAWNYLACADADGERPVCVSYLINKLQPLPFDRPVIVTLNPVREPDPRQVLREFEYDHPLLDTAAIEAQAAIDAMQGLRHTWYAGAWLGCGFHEDGLASAHAVAAGIERRAHAFAVAPPPRRVAA